MMKGDWSLILELDPSGLILAFPRTIGRALLSCDGPFNRSLSMRPLWHGTDPLRLETSSLRLATGPSGSNRALAGKKKNGHPG